MLIDGRGVVLGIAIGPANQHDMKLALPTLDGQVLPRLQPGPRRPQHLCLDKGYRDLKLCGRLRRRHYRLHMPRRSDELPAPRRARGQARRWKVERTNSWFNRFRRLLIRWEKKAANYQALVEFVAAYIAFHTAGVLG